MSAPSRLDYFKTGMQFERRVADKRKHLTEGPVSGNSGGGGVFSPGKPPALQVISEGEGANKQGIDSSNGNDESASSANDKANNKRQRVKRE